LTFYRCTNQYNIMEFINYWNEQLRSLIFLAIIASIATISVAENSHARVITKNRTSYYSVSGNNGAGIFKSISKRGPKIAKSGHVIASTTIRMDIKNVRVAVRRGRCVVTNADVHLTLHYRYPKLLHKKRHSKAVRKAWNRFMKKIRAHELKHGKIAKQLANNVHRSIRKFSTKASRKCKNLGRGAKRKFKRLSAASNARHVRFDRKEGSAVSRMTRLQKALYFAK